MVLPGSTSSEPVCLVCSPGGVEKKRMASGEVMPILTGRSRAGRHDGILNGGVSVLCSSRSEHSTLSK